jgi:hypothetical protein
MLQTLIETQIDEVDDVEALRWMRRSFSRAAQHCDTRIAELLPGTDGDRT